MQIIGNYEENGYALLRGLLPADVMRAFMDTLKRDIGDQPIALSQVANYPNLLVRPAFEIYGHHYPPMQFFLWGLTPMIRQVTGRDLVPTYDYLRIYREGDLCHVHADRHACEHSLSLTLDYSDGAPWPLEIGKTRFPAPSARVDPDFGDDDYASLAMEVGDAVLYKGVNHRHGRITANPNGWSAHLFLHWVDRNGPYADKAFDGRGAIAPVNFDFA